MSTSMHRTKLRAAASLAMVIGAVALAAAGCPSNRNGIEGQLAQARDETQAAARSGAFALASWQRGRATGSLISVQVTDARDDVVDAYQDAAELSVGAGPEADWQRALTSSMNHVIDLLNTARVVVERQPPTPTSDELRRELLRAADALNGPPS